jgi:hypothetical protein
MHTIYTITETMKTYKETNLYTRDGDIYVAKRNLSSSSSCETEGASRGERSRRRCRPHPSLADHR